MVIITKYKLEEDGGGKYIYEAKKQASARYVATACV